MTNAEADSVIAGQSARYRIEREATDAADTMVGDAELYRVRVRQ